MRKKTQLDENIIRRFLQDFIVRHIENESKLNQRSDNMFSENEFKKMIENLLGEYNKKWYNLSEWIDMALNKTNDDEYYNEIYTLEIKIQNEILNGSISGLKKLSQKLNWYMNELI